jgi:membrane protease YdiL (CAAX protease family)
MTSPLHGENPTGSLYHAAPGSAFSALGALGITFAAWATLIVVGVVVVLAGLPTMAALALGQVCLLAAPLVAMRLTQRNLGALGFARAPGVHVLGAILVGTSMWYVNLRLVSLLPIPDRKLVGIEQLIDTPPLLVVLLAVAVLPAICEEVLFRGVLVRGFASRIHAWIAIPLAALLFSIYHLNLVQLVPTFTLGIVLGAIALRANSAVPTMLAHGINNMIAILIARGEIAWLSSADGSGWLDRHPTLGLVGATATTTTGIAIAMVGPHLAMAGSKR